MSDIFRKQIAEDISLIQRNWGHLDKHLAKDVYAFNYWILSRIYSIDEELIPDLITEYRDKGIDCYVHFEDSKELYIIQNKYYDENTNLNRNEFTDFLQTPLNTLNEGTYPKSNELQKIFNTIKNDPEYTINLHFYLSNNRKSLDQEIADKNFNNNPPKNIKARLRSKINYLNDIYELYYGQSFKNEIKFKYTLETTNRGTSLKILPEEYGLQEMSKAYYMLTPVSQIFVMYKESLKKEYPLFEENIREYLGRNPINRGIITTLKDRKDRSNFFYYNNGITIICSSVHQPVSNKLELKQPQIVNGCQTVSSIYEVLNNYPDSDIAEEFKYTFVMVKVLLFDEEIKKTKSDKFYKDIVKYNNKQNSINENAFGARKTIFEKIQKEFSERGFLLLVKPSDKTTFNKDFSSEAKENGLLRMANNHSAKTGLVFNKLSDLFIPLEKLLQVYLAFAKDGFYAYTKKNTVLKQTSDIYKEYSLKIAESLTIDSLITLYLIYLKAEKKRSESADKKSPIPYYLIGFLGRSIKDKSKANAVIKGLFDKSDFFETLFEYYENLTILYKKEFMESTGIEYNAMIKKPIDNQILDKQEGTLRIIFRNNELNKFFDSLQ